MHDLIILRSTIDVLHHHERATLYPCRSLWTRSWRISYKMSAADLLSSLIGVVYEYEYSTIDPRLRKNVLYSRKRDGRGLNWVRRRLVRSVLRRLQKHKTLDATDTTDVYWGLEIRWSCVEALLQSEDTFQVMRSRGCHLCAVVRWVWRHEFGVVKTWHAPCTILQRQLAVYSH